MQRLTPMQVRILARHASGLSLKEVAKDVYVSYSAATNYIHEAKRRLEADTLAAAVMRAHALGYLSHPTGIDSEVIALEPGLDVH